LNINCIQKINLNEKLKLTNQILKNRILENENEQLRQSIEQEFNEFSMLKCILFLFIFIFLPALVLTLLVGSIANRIRFRMATN